MIVRLPGPEPGRVKQTPRVRAPGMALVEERGAGIPRPLVPAPVQVRVLVVFALSVLGVLLPMRTLAQW